MATQLYFSRDTKVFIEFDGAVWECPVLDGFSFSQGNNTSEITLSEMESTAGTSRRGRRAFNDSLAPGEWSFSTYVRPFASAGSGTGAADGAAETHAVEEVLWALMAGADNYDASTYDFDRGGNNVITPAIGSSVVNFDKSNKSTLGTFNIYFVMGDANRTVMKLKDAVVNEAGIDFEIDGIATINWSGFGKIITEVADFDASGTLDTSTTSTSNFIRNRLTSLTVTATDSTTFPGASSNGVYNVTLTGGNVTFENNITYLTPETLCTVNQPLEHVTGTRTISGNFTCYLDGTTGGSEDLFEDIIEATSTVTNEFALSFSIGGANAPKVVISMPQCHLEVPQHSIEDVISVDTTFHALPSTVSQTDEATVAYTGAA